MSKNVKSKLLPHQEEGLSQGLTRGLQQGILQATYNSAVLIVKEFGLDAVEVAKKLNISLKELKKHLEKEKEMSPRFVGSEVSNLDFAHLPPSSKYATINHAKRYYRRR